MRAIIILEKDGKPNYLENVTTKPYHKKDPNTVL
jgi:hypothetical protein